MKLIKIFMWFLIIWGVYVTYLLIVASFGGA